MRLLVSTFEGKSRIAARASWVKAGRRLLDTPEIDAPPNKPQELVYLLGGRPAAGPARSGRAVAAMVEMYGVKGFENEDRSPNENPGARDCIASIKKNRRPRNTGAVYAWKRSVRWLPRTVATVEWGSMWATCG